MARTVADAALLLAVQSGPDPRVPLALDQPPPALADPGDVPRLLAQDLRGLRVAWSADLGLPVEPEVRAALAPARRCWPISAAEVSDATPDLAGGGRGIPDLAGAAVRHRVRPAAARPSRISSARTWPGTPSAAWN